MTPPKLSDSSPTQSSASSHSLRADPNALGYPAISAPHPTRLATPNAPPPQADGAQLGTHNSNPLEGPTFGIPGLVNQQSYRTTQRDAGNPAPVGSFTIGPNPPPNHLLD